MKTKIKLSHKKKGSRKVTKGNRVNRGSRLKHKKRSHIINALRGGSVSTQPKTDIFGREINPQKSVNKSSVKPSTAKYIPRHLRKNQSIQQSKNSIIPHSEYDTIVRHFTKTPKELDLSYVGNKIEIEIMPNNCIKYKCRDYNNKVKTIYYVYPNSLDSSKPLVYIIRENTNQNITVETDIVLKHSYSITPLELNVDTMQLAINNNLNKISNDDNNTYLGFVNFPSLIVNKVQFSFNSSRLNAKWYSVYEDINTFDKNDLYLNEALYLNFQDFQEDSHKRIETKHSFKNKNNFINTLKKIKLIKEQLHIINSIQIPTDLEVSKIDVIKVNLRALFELYVNQEESNIEITEEVRNYYNKRISTIETILNKLYNSLSLDDLQELKKVLKLEEDFIYNYVCCGIRVRLEEDNDDDMSLNVTTKNNTNKTNSNNTTNNSNINYNSSIFQSFDNKPKTYIIIENIGWVMRNSMWIEKYLQLNTTYMTSKNKKDSLKGRELMALIGNEYEYECDLYGLDEKYIIVDNKTCPGYVICGYPEKKTKEIILNFWQDNDYNKELVKAFEEVHNIQETTNSNSFLDLFKEFKKKETCSSYNEANLFMNLRTDIFEYIEKRYDELYKPDYPDYTNFKVNFRKNAKEYFQKIGEKYLPKILTKINYVFLVFKKNNSNALEPFIFNVKELIPEHKPILEQIERLIKHELSYRFGILSDAEYNNGKGNETDPFDDEYKLWYSRYSYSEFFHITTEYVHTMSNISDKAHGYKNSIILEELIYACGLNSDLGNPFFKDIRLEYEIREYKINKKIKLKETDVTKFPSQSTDCAQYEVGKPNEFRSDFVFCLYEKEKLRRESQKDIQMELTFNTNFNENTIIKLKTEKDFEFKKEEKLKEQAKKKGIDFFKTLFTTKNQSENKIRFILIFKTHKQNYTFIYSYNGKFYKLVIESNISKIVDDIINELNKKVLSNNFNDMVIKFNDLNKCFIVVSNDEVDIHDYKDIFNKNPFIISNIKQIPDTVKLDLSYYYETSLLKPKLLGIFTNLYIIVKPYIYTNSIKGKQYIQGFQKYINDLKNNKPLNIYCNTLTFEEKYKDCVLSQCSSYEVIINCVFYNIGDSGYDIIESIDNIVNKIVLYIVPHNYNYNNNFLIKPDYRQKYLGNFLDLEESSLSILNEIKKKYSNNDYLCFIHQTMQLRFYCLHFHIIKKEYYKRNFPKTETGSFMIQDMFIEDVINNIKNNINYYKMLNYNIIKTT